MPAGLSALLNMIGRVGQQLLNAFTYIFGWVFTNGDGGTLTNWPVLIQLYLWFLYLLSSLLVIYPWNSLVIRKEESKW